MKRFLLSTILGVLIQLSVKIHLYCQEPTTIILEYKRDKLLKDSFSFHIMKPFQAETFGEPFLYQDSMISYSQKDNICQTISRLFIKDTTCAYVFEMFGHEIITWPGDTIKLKALPLQSSTAKQPSGFPSRNPGLYILSYAGANAEMNEFTDSLTQIAGDLRFDKIAFKKPDDIQDFLAKAQKLYDFRMDYLAAYRLNHRLPDFFYRLFSAEIKSAFIINICNPLEVTPSNVNNFPKKYTDVLDGCTFTDEYLYYHTSLYADYVLAVTRYLVSKNMRQGEDINVKTYQLLEEVKPGALRDHMMTNFFFKYVTVQNTSYDSLFKTFKVICRNEQYKNYLSEIVNKNELRVARINSLKLQDALASAIHDSANALFTLKDKISNGKPTIIDCWATWCVPCMKELPFEKEFERVYGKKLNFIYLSFDRSEKVWQSRYKDIGLKKNYFLVDGFKSNFTNYFRINSIPRYIIIDKDGNVFTPDAVRPSKKAAFEEMIKKLI